MTHILRDILKDEIGEQEILALNKCHIFTGEDFITSSPLSIMSVLRCTYSHYVNITAIISQWIAPNHQTGLSLYLSYKDTSLPLHISRLDAALLGGLPAGTVTEISGPPGSGKTQLSLMLSVISCSRGGSDREVIFIDTNCSFSAQRLWNIAESWSGSISSRQGLNDTIRDIASRVKVYTELTCDQLEKRIVALRGVLGGVGMIVIDSLADLVRKEYDTRTAKGVMDRYQYLSRISNLLKRYADERRVSVIITSQVTTQYNSQLVNTSLGVSWGHCVDTRLFVEFWKDKGKRKLSIVKNPAGRLLSVIVTIEKKGLVYSSSDTNQLDEDIVGDSNTYSMIVRDHVDTYTHTY